jgi:hypothetical protein
MNFKLKQKIIEKFGSQIRFARVVGEPETIVSKVVRGWRIISSDKQNKWAKVLKCKVDDVFNE